MSSQPLSRQTSGQSLGDIPSIEELRDERIELLRRIRHHKDEQDSIALDIENQPGASEVYRSASRVLFLETFVSRCSEYVADTLPMKIKCMEVADEINSEKKIAKFIKELQAKREHTLSKISEIQDRLERRSDPQRWYMDAVKAKYETNKDEFDQQMIDHTLENYDERDRLISENKKLREQKSSQEAKLLRTNYDTKIKENHYENAIKKAKLVNLVNARLCRDINVANASNVNNLQVVMNELNTEYYGIGKAPRKKDLPKLLEKALEEVDKEDFFIEASDITEEDIKRIEEKKKSKK